MTPRTARRVAVLSSWAVFLVSLSVGMTGVAGADDAAPTLTLRAVDSSVPTDTELTVHWTGDPSKIGDLVLTEEGTEVDGLEPKSLADAGYENDVMFVVDTSGTASDSGLVNKAKAAVVGLTNDLEPGTRVGLVGAGLRSVLAVNLTEDTDAISDGVKALATGDDGAVWDGVAQAARRLDRTGEHSVRNIVLITDGQVDDSTKTAEALDLNKRRALAAVQETGATVSILAVGDIGPLQALATESGGALVQLSGVDQVKDAAPQLTDGLGGFYVASFSSKIDGGVSDISLSIGDVRVQNSFVAGSVLRDARSLAPVPTVSSSTGVEALQGKVGLGLAVGLTVLAVLLAVGGLVMLLTRDSVGLDSMLQVYDDSYSAAEEEGPRAQGALVQRAVGLTEQLATSRGMIPKYEAKLERADMPLRPAEYLLICGLITVVLMLVVLFATGVPLFSLIVLVLGLVVPGSYLNFKGARRRKKFEALLPDMLQLLSGTLKAGYSMMQGIEAVAVEVAEPMGKELRRVMTEARLGRPLEESLDSVAERMDSKDFGWAVMAIRIQREVGGNLSELLMTVSTTMVLRERLRRDVDSLTAEGRVSAYMLGLMPVALMIAMYVMNPTYMMPLFEETTGKALLGGGALMIVGGFLWMNKIVKVEI